ncbi:hypothetical protein PAECIP111893_01823 [Paenibacillus plantiphilus]|uniref:Tfp pilus assembly protein PilO n=1 Tax=Paenibacillus plantiphilus TaxID=2905650 RepID=A0ABM9C4U2_9BACL|nr:hypothetical protein [Paenibacillus plantiphilus]CAH1202532.1 hypothetical protein PAECIP111893_01823 [Paenibacillus plantiphilus]
MNTKSLLNGREFANKSIILLIVVIVIGVGMNLVMYYIYNSKSVIVDDYMLERDRLERRINVLEQQKEAPVVNEADLKRLLVKVPLTAELSPYLTKLTEIESENGAEILSLNLTEPADFQITTGPEQQAEKAAITSESVVEPSTDADGVNSVPSTSMKQMMNQSMSLSLTGELEQLKGFLNSLLQFERITRVEQFSINVNEDGESAMSIQLNRYWAPGYAEALAPKSEPTDESSASADTEQ